MAERLSGQPNALAVLIAQAVPYAPWLLAALVVGALLSFWRTRPNAA